MTEHISDNEGWMYCGLKYKEHYFVGAKPLCGRRFDFIVWLTCEPPDIARVCKHCHKIWLNRQAIRNAEQVTTSVASSDEAEE